VEIQEVLDEGVSQFSRDWADPNLCWSAAEIRTQMSRINQVRTWNHEMIRAVRRAFTRNPAFLEMN
jgi:hypothetical protein